MAKLQPTVLRGGDWTWIRLQGVVDEDNRLHELAREVKGSLLLVDLRGIQRINSCGVRDWVAWLDEVGRGEADTVLVDCSPAIVAQLNLVGNFARHARVLSIRAPFYCESCDVEHSRGLDVVSLLQVTSPSAPGVPCPRCGKQMAFDDIEESYFGFLGEVRPAHGSPQLDRAMSEARQRLGEPVVGVARSGSPGATASTTSRTLRRSPAEAAEAGGAGAPPLAPAAPAKAPPRTSLSRGDIVFYVVIGALCAVLLMVVLQIASH